MIYLTKNKEYVIEITKSAQNLIMSKSKKSKKEVCGILVGHKNNKTRFTITHSIVDKKTRIRSPSYTVRKTKNVYPELQRIINQYNEIDYVGEWHSHPGGYRKRSKIDHNTMMEMVENPKFGNLDNLILLITVKTSKMNFQLLGYIYQERGSEGARIIKVDDSIISTFLV